MNIVDRNKARAQAELADRILARRHLLHFTKRFNPRYIAGWVHEDICRRLECFSDQVEAGTSPRLMLLMPPRVGKSELASRNFPPWHLGRFPHHEIIACTYAISLAMSFSRKAKGIIDDPAYQGVFPGVQLNPNNSATEEWGLLGQTGGYVAAGVGGGITGKGAHVLIIDDPVKNAEEADSALRREAIWEWFTSTAYTRLAPGGGVLVIQTWWHDDDLAGRLQRLMAEDPEADQYEVIKYPAISLEDEYLDYDTDLIVYGPAPENGVLLRQKGEALHPARYDLKKLNAIKRTLPPRWWSALYQQNPVPDDGAYFKRSEFRELPTPEVRKCNVFISFDFAISENQQNDYTVGVVGLQDSNDILHIAEVIRFRSGDAFFIVEAILNLAQRWYHSSLTIGLEDGQIYRSISALLSKRMRERKFYLHIDTLKPITDKQARGKVLQGRMQQGMVAFAAGASWLDVVRNEMLRFPAGVHDDCVDALAWLAQLVVGREPPRPPKLKTPKSWRDKLRLGSKGSSHMAA